jgi:uncharacterized protein YjiS (DUF1127 family)
MTTAIATPSGAGVLATGSERALGISGKGLRAVWTRYRAFRATVAELEALTERQLSDVGIARAGIRNHVRDAIYGK